MNTFKIFKNKTVISVSYDHTVLYTFKFFICLAGK